MQKVAVGHERSATDREVGSKLAAGVHDDPPPRQNLPRLSMITHDDDAQSIAYVAP